MVLDIVIIKISLFSTSEPHVKRDLCKGCGNLLKPGVSSRNRVRSGKMILTCLRCGTIKRFPLNTDYNLWIEREEACLEVIEVPNGSEEVEDSAPGEDKQSSARNSEHEQSSWLSK